MQRLQTGDEVVVLAGRSRGRRGALRSINRKTETVVVEGANLVRKSVKPTERDPKGGHVQIEAPLHVSNVALVDPQTKKPTRVRIERREGRNVRVAVASGTVLKPKPRKKK